MREVGIAQSIAVGINRFHLQHTINERKSHCDPIDHMGCKDSAMPSNCQTRVYGKNACEMQDVFFRYLVMFQLSTIYFLANYYLFV